MNDVTLSNYQSDWPLHFERIEAALRARVDLPFVQLEHIGSTSVPGLCAKPVIDVLLGARSLNEIAFRAAQFANLGFRYRPEFESVIPERRYFVRDEITAVGSTSPRVHLHGVVYDGTFWQRHLAFRDALRADAALAQRYAELKRNLATQFAHDKSAYTDAKAPFIQQVLVALGHGSS
jgi:GrpB-like predicted nucleotidyltransferase (UPF0157 family)